MRAIRTINKVGLSCPLYLACIHPNCNVCVCVCVCVREGLLTGAECVCVCEELLTGVVGHGRPGDVHGVEGDDRGLEEAALRGTLLWNTHTRIRTHAYAHTHTHTHTLCVNMCVC